VTTANNKKCRDAVENDDSNPDCDKLLDVLQTDHLRDLLIKRTAKVLIISSAATKGLKNFRLRKEGSLLK
jgi:hypothetical protein